ncbi:TfoX/Sxy family protein [Psychromicrobium xiongbiense]|uniref:TfoX/Sxy family protein n=1 Tax=Psychromicrobium xiongbiense TaxID=3051184 RepID=UPI002556D778|nr:TfoX/Sxy family protein [Psychromicrobium sp. YIM S02556]
MDIPRPSEEGKEFFRSIIPDAPGVVVKPMFGNLGAFVNGNMFAGMFGESIGVRVLDETLQAELSAIPGTGAFGPAERAMGGYTSLPADWRQAPGLAAEWIGIALEQVGHLPAKQPKPRKKTTP